MLKSRANNRRRGFTLVEILIVVVILGILAAIVIPQFTNASQNARESSLQSTLQTLRSQIQFYKLQHGDVLPNLVTDWTPFTGTTTFGTQTFGPYMQAISVNTMNSFSNVTDGTVALGGATAPTVSTACGFVYDYNSAGGSGQIYGTDNSGSTPGTVIAGTTAGGVFTPY